MIDAFVSEPATTQPEDSTATSMRISLGDFDLNDIRLDYRDETNSSSAAVSWKRFHARITDSDIEQMRFGARETSVTGLYLAYRDQVAGLEIGRASCRERVYQYV